MWKKWLCCEKPGLVNRLEGEGWSMVLVPTRIPFPSPKHPFLIPSPFSRELCSISWEIHCHQGCIRFLYLPTPTPIFHASPNDLLIQKYKCTSSIVLRWDSGAIHSQFTVGSGWRSTPVETMALLSCPLVKSCPPSSLSPKTFESPFRLYF